MGFVRADAALFYASSAVDFVPHLLRAEAKRAVNHQVGGVLVDAVAILGRHPWTTPWT